MLTLADWLIVLEQRASSSNIILDLERIKLARSELDLTSFNAKVIKIAGTNGKGSAVAALNQIYTAAGYRVACYSSPHLFKFNERLKINDKYAEDSLWCQAFCFVDDSSRKHNLTYFETITIAAFWIIKQHTLDIVLLEIGLGGRLDAVNVAAADIGLITSIGLDHQDRLGSTLEEIAKEKAGIINKDMSVVFTGRNNRDVVAAAAGRHNCKFFALGSDFSWEMANNKCWVYNCCETSHSMPIPNIHPDVAAGVITCITLLQPNLPVASKYIFSNLPNIQQYARCQIVKKTYPIVIDVAHNQPAVIYLKQFIRSKFAAQKLRLVFACLNTKDYKSMLSEFDCNDAIWYLSDLGVANGVNKQDMRQALSSECFLFPNVSNAFEKAYLDCKSNEVIVVFGSFHVAKEVLLFLDYNNN